MILKSAIHIIFCNIRSGGNNCVFGFGLDIIFRYVLFGFVHRNFIFHLLEKLISDITLISCNAWDSDCK